MTPRLTTDYAQNYCNRTLIVKVIVENVVTCFLWDTVCVLLQYFDAVGWVSLACKNRRPYNLYCVGDVKPCSINLDIISLYRD